MKKISLLIMLALIMVKCKEVEPERTAHKGKPLPEFKLFLADSSTYFNTASLPLGKPILFFYFGPRCPYSRAQMEEMIGSMNEFKGVEIVALTTSPFLEMKWFYKNYELVKYKNVRAGVDYTNFFRNYFNTQGVPYMAIYGKDKKLKDVFLGQMPIEQLKNALID